MNDWLDKFDDDPREPKRPRDPRSPRPPRWLDKFRDDKVPREPRPQPREQRPRDARIPKMSPPGTSTARPQEILIFGGLMAVSLVLGLIATSVAYPRLSRAMSGLEILLPEFVVILLIGGFVYLVAWLRQFWAVWILVAFCAVRFFLYVPTFLNIESVFVKMLTVCYFMLQAAAFWFVFTPAAKQWLKAKRP
jgi:hypothetical protein